MNEATALVVLDKRFKNSKNEFVVKLRVTHEGKQKYYPLKLKLSEDDWGIVKSKNPKGDYKEHKLLINGIEEKAEEVIDTLDYFSFEEFERNFNKKQPTGNNNIEFYYQSHIDDFYKTNHVGSAIHYTTSMKSILLFHSSRSKETLTAPQINIQWLKEYQAWMLSIGNSITTVGIYLRGLRTIINKIIDAGYMSREAYPFGKKKYVIPQGRNIKKALDKEMIKNIVDFDCPTTSYERARDLWYFSYLCNGMNFVDIAHLKWEDIDSKFFHYFRIKIINTSVRDIKPIIVPLLPETLAIIKKWGNKKSKFVFDMLDGTEDEIKIRKKVYQLVKNNNKYTKLMGADLGLNFNLTTYHARHSFATAMLRNGASVDLIRGSLGHSDPKTTQSYLADFDIETKLKFQQGLV